MARKVTPNAEMSDRFETRGDPDESCSHTLVPPKHLNLLELIELFDQLTERRTCAGRIMQDLTERGSDALNDAQARAFHDLADEFGTRALKYVTERGTDRDGCQTSPGMIMIQNAQIATERWRKLGVPRGHILDYGFWAVSRAADAAFTWAYITLGHVEAARRYVDLEKVVTESFSADHTGLSNVVVVVDSYRTAPGVREPLLFVQGADARISPNSRLTIPLRPGPIRVFASVTLRDAETETNESRARMWTLTATGDPNDTVIVRHFGMSAALTGVVHRDVAQQSPSGNAIDIPDQEPPHQPIV